LASRVPFVTGRMEVWRWPCEARNLESPLWPSGLPWDLLGRLWRALWRSGRRFRYRRVGCGSCVEAEEPGRKGGKAQNLRRFFGQWRGLCRHTT
jgi:hypothetical protein